MTIRSGKKFSGLISERRTNMSQTGSRTVSYTASVEIVVRRVKADFRMIADSTGGWTERQVEDYAHDIEVLAKHEYLEWVDVTLFSRATEIQAARYTVNTETSRLESDRPGNALWPKMPNSELRIVLRLTDTGHEEFKKLHNKLRINWTGTYADTSHAALVSGGDRTYSSGDFSMSRQDWVT